MNHTKFLLDTCVRVKLFDQLCEYEPGTAELYIIRKSLFFWSQRYSPWAVPPTIGPRKKSQSFNPEGVTLDMFCSSLSSDRTRARRIPSNRARRARQNRVFTFLMRLAVAEKTGCEPLPAVERVTLDLGGSYPRPGTFSTTAPADDVPHICAIYHSIELDETVRTMSFDFRCASSSSRKSGVSRCTTN